MAQKYRLVKVHDLRGQSDHAQQKYDNSEIRNGNHEIVVVQSPRGHVTRWILTMAAIVVVVLVALWMNEVWSSLAHLSQTTNQVGATLKEQQSQLSGIAAHLNSISGQFNQLRVDLRTLFTSLLQAVHRG